MCNSLSGSSSPCIGRRMLAQKETFIPVAILALFSLRNKKKELS
jgi:hypothetical protein